MDGNIEGLEQSEGNKALNTGISSKNGEIGEIAENNGQSRVKNGQREACGKDTSGNPNICSNEIAAVKTDPVSKVAIHKNEFFNSPVHNSPNPKNVPTNLGNFTNWDAGSTPIPQKQNLDFETKISSQNFQRQILAFPNPQNSVNDPQAVPKIMENIIPPKSNKIPQMPKLNAVTRPEIKSSKNNEEKGNKVSVKPPVKVNQIRAKPGPVPRPPRKVLKRRTPKVSWKKKKKIVFKPISNEDQNLFSDLIPKEPTNWGINSGRKGREF